MEQTFPQEVVGTPAPLQSVQPLQTGAAAKTIRVQTDGWSEGPSAASQHAGKNCWKLRVNIRDESCFINSYRKGELLPLHTTRTLTGRSFVAQVLALRSVDFSQFSLFSQLVLIVF